MTFQEKLEKLDGVRSPTNRWWRRGDYMGNYSTDPLWHLYSDWTQSPPNRYAIALKAKCGYTRKFDLILGEEPLIKVEVKTKSLQCKSCLAKEAKES